MNDDLTDAQKAFIRVRKELRAVDRQLREEAASEALWREYGQGDWVAEAVAQQERVDAVRQQSREELMERVRLEALRTEVELG